MEYENILQDHAFLKKLRQELAGQICVWGDPSRLHIDESARMVNTLFNTSSGMIDIGANTFTGHNVCILAGKHNVTATGLQRMDFPKDGLDIIIGNGVWIASNATILGPCRIGDDAVVAAGSVVVPGTCIQKKELWAGIPARKVKDIPCSDNIDFKVKEESSMQHRQADLLMKEVEKHYKGDFLLNGDLQLSRQTAAVLRKKENNRFYGSNGLFSPAKMFGTEGCEKTADCITVPQGGTVYGPYFTFPAGAYTAQFRVEQAEAVTVSVFSQKRGIIASQAVSSPQDAVISLDFSLPDLTEQVEFKVENRAAVPIIFRSVEIIPENLQMSEPEALAPEANTAEVAASDASASLIDDLNDALALKRQSDRQQKELAQKADCDLPAHTRLRRIKLLLRRLMRPFTLMQTVFNHSVVASLHNLQEQINLLLAALTKIDRQQLSHVSFREDERNSFTVRYEKMQQQNAALSERLDALTATLAQIQDAPKADPAAQREIASLWDKIKEYDANFRGIWKSEGDINANLGSVWSTYSNFRQEIFYELDARTRSAGAAQPLRVETKIKDSAREKMLAADGQIRLNLGSGNLAVEGYLNTDARDLPNVDIVADVAALPFEAGTVDEIFSAHLIEHFTRSRMEKELLPYWYSLLKPGGTFRVIFPDLEAMIDAYNASQMSFEQMGNVIMGGQDYQLDYHYTVYSPETVTKLLEKAGLRNIRILAQGRENGGCKETEILAEK